MEIFALTLQILRSIDSKYPERKQTTLSLGEFPNWVQPLIQALTLRIRMNGGKISLCSENLREIIPVVLVRYKHTPRQKNPANGKRSFFFQELGPEEKVAYLNLDGKDVKFERVKEGKRPDEDKVGSTYSDIFKYKDITLTIRYTVSKLPCPECEGTDYDVVVMATRRNYTVAEKGYGSCGC